MARLTARDWEAARKLWEADPDMSAADVGKRFGVSKQAVQKKIDSQKWTKAPKVAGETVSEVVEIVATTKSTTSDNQIDNQQDSGQGKKRLTEAQWLEARIEWEGDERKTNGFIAEKYGVSIRAVKERINVDGWTRRIHKQMVHVPKPRPPWRPTAYTEDLPDRLIAYFRQPAFEVVGADQNSGIRGKIVNAYVFPTLERFADSIGVCRDTLHSWASETDAGGKLKRPAFSDAYARARNLQVAIAAEGIFAEVFKSAAVTLAMRNLLGWRTEIEQEKQDDDAYPSREELDRMYAKVTANSKEWNEAAKNRVIPDPYRAYQQTKG